MKILTWRGVWKRCQKGGSHICHRQNGQNSHNRKNIPGRLIIGKIPGQKLGQNHGGSDCQLCQLDLFPVIPVSVTSFGNFGN